MTVVTIEIPDHQMLGVQTIAKVIHHVGYSLDAVDLSVHKSATYQTEESHIFLSSIGDCVYSVKRGVDDRT